jgi:heme oxygenase
MKTKKIALTENEIRQVLRDQTSDLHARLHEHTIFRALLAGRLSFNAYRELLRRLHGFYVPLDDAIDRLHCPNPEIATNYRHYSRSTLLARDLLDLGASDQAIRDMPLCNSVYDFVSMESLGGIIYVIEGAMLGGAHIDRAAQKLLGHDNLKGRHYWAWCRTHGKRRWPQALRLLGQLHANGVDTSKLSAGAVATFRAFAEWIEPLNQGDSGVLKEAL